MGCRVIHSICIAVGTLVKAPDRAYCGIQKVSMITGSLIIYHKFESCAVYPSRAMCGMGLGVRADHSVCMFSRC